MRYDDLRRQLPTIAPGPVAHALTSAETTPDTHVVALRRGITPNHTVEYPSFSSIFHTLILLTVENSAAYCTLMSNSPCTTPTQLYEHPMPVLWCLPLASGKGLDIHFITTHL